MVFAESSGVLNTLTAVVALIVVATSGIAVALVVRTQRVKTTMQVQDASIGSLSKANEGLTAALEFERSERQREHTECATKIGHLQGQIDALSGEIGSGIAKAAVSAVLAALQETGALQKKET